MATTYYPCRWKPCGKPVPQRKKGPGRRRLYCSEKHQRLHQAAALLARN